MTPAANMQGRTDLIGLLRQFAARTARERGVSDPHVKNQLGLMNALARQLLTQLCNG